MSDASQKDGWRQAPDGRWYAPSLQLEPQPDSLSDPASSTQESALSNTCANGHQMRPGDTYCRQCGAPLAPRNAMSSVLTPASSAAQQPLPTAAPYTSSAPDKASWTQGRKGWIVTIVALGVLVLALTTVLLVSSFSKHKSASVPQATNPSSAVTHAAAPDTTSTGNSQQGSERQQGQALTDLLSQSSGDRSGVQSATQAIASCGDLVSAEATLNAARLSRQGLLSQLTDSSFSQLPQSAALIGALSSAWQNSAESDGSYAQWAADEQSNGCVPNNTSDSNYQAAQVTDRQATTAKQQFTNMWNPIATSLGLQTWQPSQL
jgi:hypothetical protein